MVAFYVRHDDNSEDVRRKAGKAAGLDEDVRGLLVEAVYTRSRLWWGPERSPVGGARYMTGVTCSVRDEAGKLLHKVLLLFVSRLWTTEETRHSDLVGSVAMGPSDDYDKEFARWARLVWDDLAAQGLLAVEV